MRRFVIRWHEREARELVSTARRWIEDYERRHAGGQAQAR
jgi:hypothetical protein